MWSGLSLASMAFVSVCFGANLPQEFAIFVPSNEKGLLKLSPTPAHSWIMSQQFSEVGENYFQQRWWSTSI